jgi:hypothetical protein
VSRQPDPAAIAVLASQLRLDEKRLLEAMERRGMACYWSGAGPRTLSGSPPASACRCVP